jgi:20S proteasome alpha/beta subunit
MTIALGLKALDGIILCSDSQIGIPQYMKHSGRKVFSLGSESNGPNRWAIGFTYSGDPERMDSLYEKMQDSLYKSNTIDKGAVKSSFEQALTEVRSSIINPPYEDADILCGGSTSEDELFLFSGKNGVVTESKEFVLLGIGDSSLSRYLENLFPKGRTLIDFSTGLVVGAYIVEQAAKYVDGVEGPLQLCLLRAGYPPKNFYDLTVIHNLTKAMDQILRKSLVLSLGVEFEGIDYEEGQTAYESLMADIHNLRREIQKLNWLP